MILFIKLKFYTYTAVSGLEKIQNVESKEMRHRIQHAGYSDEGGRMKAMWGNTGNDR